MKSMTGFGRSATTNQLPTQTSAAVRDSTGVDLEVAVKAVNGRYLDVRFHLPREYAGLEAEFKAVLAPVFKRGTLDVYMNRARSEAGGGRVRVNHELAKQWLEAYRELAGALHTQAQVPEPSLDLLSRVPDVLVVEHSTSISENEANLAKDLLVAAAEACDRERQREGLALAAELERLCTRLGEIAEEAEILKEAAKAELEKRTLARLEDHLRKLGFNGKIDEQRLAQEIVISLDRVDIAEELQRLREHIRAYRALLQSSVSEGKKLDFYAQELLREVNTIGSKSHIASLTSLVVEAKTLVERIREQVQNVE
jgi:uncharacterized protein (TIGR00255 family)